MNNNDNKAWTKEEFEAALRGMEKYYHIHHPYHTLMNAGKLTKEQLQGWVANRFYYQVSIPIKDANILANCPDRETRAKWERELATIQVEGLARHIVVEITVVVLAHRLEAQNIAPVDSARII